MAPEGEQRPFPLKEFLGFEIDRSDGVAVAVVDLDQRHHNPFGTAHGAVAFTLMDTAMGAAVMSVVDEGSLCATIEIHTRFHAGARAGQLRAEARVVSAGRRVVHLAAETRTATGTLVASATASFAVFPAPPGTSG